MMTEKLLSVTGVGAEWILWLLFVLSLMSWAVIIERFISLRNTIAESLKVTRRAQEALKANDLSVLDSLSKNYDALEGRLLDTALRHVNTKGAKGVEEVITGFVIMERPNLEKNLSFLATLGSNAPFIGLLGTVMGIIKAFADLAASQGNPTVVMQGISEALIATAVGLFVAIPAVISYNFFQRQVKLVIQNAESIKNLCVAYSVSK